MCKSDRISLWMGGYTGMMYRCPDCGYVGPVVIETDPNIPGAAAKDRHKE
jgi:phage-related protein